MHRRHRFLIVLLATFFASQAVGPPEADARRKRPPNKQRIKLARKLYKHGDRLYSLGRFAEAKAKFSKAYEVLPLPGFLFNIAQCHRQLDECPRAIFFFKGYIRKRPDARNRDLVLRLIKECEQRIAEKKRLAAEEKRRREEAERRRRAITQPVVKVVPVPTPVGPKKDEPPVHRRWWFWTAVGGSVLAVALAVGLGVGFGYKAKEVDPSGSLGTIYW